MKKIDNVFSILYVLSFLGSIIIILLEVYEVQAILGYATRPEGIIGMLYLFGLLVSAFYHHQISKRDVVTGMHKTLTVFTILTFVSLICIILVTLFCTGERCMLVLLPTASTIGLWIISFVLGIFTLKQKI